METVVITNLSTTLSDADIQKVIPALQKQVSNHLAPKWHVDATLAFLPKAQNPPAGSYRILIRDTSDFQNDPGYHTCDDSGPVANIFAKTAQDNGQKWTVTFSHELLEMLVNPYTNRAAFLVARDRELMGSAQDSGLTGTYIDLEVCDAVSSDENGYDVDGVTVSDFVYPEWFAPWLTAQQYDQNNKLSSFAPQVAPGNQIAASTTGRYQEVGAAQANLGSSMKVARKPSSFRAK
jgi:hypothetical protein